MFENPIAAININSWENFFCTALCMIYRFVCILGNTRKLNSIKFTANK